MSSHPFSGNPIVDAWLAAWTNSLNLTTQLTSTWLGQQQGGGNPWAALNGAMGTAWPMASMTGAGSANPWAAFSGGTAANPFASLAGLQSMMSLAMATWGGAAPPMGGMPFPWNASNLANFGTWANGMSSWPATGQRMGFGPGGGWPVSWPMIFTFPGMPGMQTAAAPALPWPWNQFFPSQQGTATPAFGWPQGMFSGVAPQAPRDTPAAAENDPMGFGQAMKFWSSLVPASAPPQPPRASKPEPAPADPATDLTKLFPWMSWMK
jgi:hypothetical protein